MSVGSLRRRNINAALLKTIVEQFIARDIHPAGDLKPFEELVLGLIDRLDPAEAAEILQPLHAHPDTPPRVGDRLKELRAAAKTPLTPEGPETARKRPTFKELNGLNANHLRELASDLSLNFDPAMRQTLACAAREDLTLARILLDRDDLDLDPATFFLAATRLERQAIVLDACRRAIIDGCNEILPADPNQALRFEEAAAAQNLDRIAELAALTLNLHPAPTRMIVAEASGEALALLMIAMGFDSVFGARILASTPLALAHNDERKRKLMALMRATPQRAAKQIITAVAGQTYSQQAQSETTRRREHPATPREETLSLVSGRLPGAA